MLNRLREAMPSLRLYARDKDIRPLRGRCAVHSTLQVRAAHPQLRIIRRLRRRQLRIIRRLRRRAPLRALCLKLQRSIPHSPFFIPHSTLTVFPSETYQR